MSDLSDAVMRELTFQSYQPPPTIEGVWLRDLEKHRAENGAFMELGRYSEAGLTGLPVPFVIKQMNVSWAHPGRINAFHAHPKLPQSELWTVIAGQLKVWLVDCRSGFGTEGLKQAVLLSGEAPALLHIPAGVVHGYRAGAEGATLIYLVDQRFDPTQPNEGRLPWDMFGSDLWEEDRG